MKFQDMMDKMKKVKMEEILSFCKKNFKYITAGALFIILVFVLVNCTNISGQNGGNAIGVSSTEVAGADGIYKVNENKDINKLVSDYFTAYAKADVDSISKIATPVSDNEKSYISMFSQYVESYKGIKCYVKQGSDKKSYLVSVYLEMKFKGVNTVAPGLDFFYIQTKKDGSLYINNLYSQYNLLNKEQPLDSKTEKLINKFEKENDVVALQSDVQSKYEAAIASDANLATMVNTTVANAYTTWSAQIAAKGSSEAATKQQQPSTQKSSAAASTPASTQAASTPAASTPAVATPAPAASTPASQPAAAATPALTATNDTVYALDTVKIRDSASDTGNKLGSATVGMKFTRNGTTADGWSQIQYNGGLAYIKSEYLTTDASQTGKTASTTTTSASASEGSSVRLSSTTNIRSSMSDSADRVGVAYQGDTVKVIADYAEGWSKVSWNGQTGYVKTNLLK